ncbi:MAG: DUF4350 domain-containing protein [Planctomycetota bacterium]
MRHAGVGLQAGLGFLGAAMLHGLAGQASHDLRALSAWGALCACALVAAGAGGLRARALPLAAAIAGLLAAGAGLFFADSILLRGVAFALALGALGPALRPLAAALLAGTLGVTLASHLPWADGLLRGLATTIAQAAHDVLGGHAGETEHATGAALDVGPSGIGLGAALLALWLLLAAAVRGAFVRALLGAVAVGAAVFCQAPAIEWIGLHVGPYASHGHPPVLFESVGWVALVCAFAVAWAWAGPRISAQPEAASDAAPDAAPPGSDASPAATDFAVLAAGVLGALALLVAVGWSPPRGELRRALFLNAGGIDWDRPTPQDPGIYGGGMFGLLPDYLAHDGWEVGLLELDAVAALEPGDADVLVMINCPHVWEGAERERVEGFVRAGGSLLVLGDHTDVFGLMKGFNSLLEPWGMRFRFDSAYHAGAHWGGDVDWLPGLLGLGGDPRGAHIGIGASLEVQPPAVPILNARYVFGDHGDRARASAAFLGDYKYAEGEPLGDLALAAGRRLGDGKVVAYGDTSGFQNGTLPDSFVPHIGPVFDALSARPWVVVPPLVDAALVALVLLLVGAGALGLRAAPRTALALGWTVLLGGLVYAEAARRAVHDPARYRGALLIDRGLHPATGHQGADWNVIAPLEAAAFRSGLLTYGTDAWGPDSLAAGAAPAAVAIVAPAVTPPAERCEALLRYAEEGGTLLVAASGDDGARLRPLLTPLGVEVAGARTGSLPKLNDQIESEPRFLDPSPLLVSHPEARELYRYGDATLATAVPVGAGWAVVLGDSRFFSARNTEGRWGWWSGNLRFMHDLLGEYVRAPRVERPAWEAPEEEEDAGGAG